MAEPAHPILLAFDFTQTAREALAHTAILVARMPVHVLHVVCVLEPGRPLPAMRELAGDETKVEHAIHALLETTVRPAAKLAALRVYVHVRVGTPATEILAVAREVAPALVLIGSRNVHRRDHFASGSVSQLVVHGANCSVEVVRETSYVVPAELPETCFAAKVYDYAATPTA